MNDVLAFLSDNKSMIIPDYQRNYCWEKTQCEELFDDLISVMESKQQHYLGAIICLTDEKGGKRIIDGQQRLTTLSLLILAMIQVSKTNKIIINSNAEYYNTDLKDAILNSNGNKKLHLRRSNENSRDSGDFNKIVRYVIPEAHKISTQIMNNGERIQKMKNEMLTRMETNFNYFYDRIIQYASRQSTPDVAGEKLYEGIGMLILSNLELRDSRYDPQQVFESMNATGQALTEFDKCRNFFLITTRDDENELIESWKDLESNILDSKLRDKFMFTFLKLYSRTESKSRKNILHETDYYKYIKSIFKSQNNRLTKVGFLNNVLKASYHFKSMIECIDHDKNVEQSLKRLALSDNTQFWPVILYLYNERSKNKITDTDFSSVLNIIESYIFRRQVCALDSRSAKTLIDNILTSFNKYPCQNKATLVKTKLLNTNKDSAKMPSDDAFRHGLDLLSYRDRRKLIESILLAIEYRYCSDAKSNPTTNKCSIEHIMPESEHLSDDWKKELMETSPNRTPEQIQKDWCHRLGNLTLLEIRYNNAYQDKTYSTKRNFTIKNDDEESISIGYKNCAFRMTRKLADDHTTSWSEASIKQRHKEIIDTCLKIWPYPLSSNTTEIDQVLTYTLDENLDKKDFTNRALKSFSILSTDFEIMDYKTLLLDILKYLEDDHIQHLSNIASQNSKESLITTNDKNNIAWPDHDIYLSLPRKCKTETYNFITRLKPILEACSIDLGDVEFSLI